MSEDSTNSSPRSARITASRTKSSRVNFGPGDFAFGMQRGEAFSPRKRQTGSTSGSHAAISIADRKTRSLIRRTGYMDEPGKDKAAPDPSGRPVRLLVSKGLPTAEQLAKLYERLTGRQATPEALEQARARLAKFSATSPFAPSKDWLPVFPRPV